MTTMICPGTIDRHCGEEIGAQDLLVEHLVSEHGHERRYAEDLALRAASVNSKVREIIASLRRDE